jgi:hypothetical protein
VEREDPAKLHVCIPTITLEGDSYRRRVAEARKAPQDPAAGVTAGGRSKILRFYMLGNITATVRL